MEEKKTPETGIEKENELEEIKEIAEAIEETEEKAEEISSDNSKESSDPLASFLAREEAKDKERFSKDKDASKKFRIPWWIAVPAVVVIALVAVLLILKLNPDLPGEDDIVPEAQVEVKVDDKGEYQAEVPTDAQGEIVQNGSGVLLSYQPADVAQIDVENQNGSFTVTSYTPVTTDENGSEVTDTTVYTLVGFESFDLQTGMADAVANDAANLSFSTIAAVDANLPDFGFDKPRAVVKVRYTDDTSSVITVGAEAPSGEGTYFTFGESSTVYLAGADYVDSFLYSVNDLISLSVTTAADDVDSSQFSSLEITGTRYDETIVLEPNSDEAIKTDYLMTAPYKMFASAAESADIAGAVRGVYAEKVLCVNPSESQLSQYGLLDPYARVVAHYPDSTIEILSSAPDADGSVCIMTPDKAVVYSIQLGAVEWANTSVEKLRPDEVLELNIEAITSITVDANGIKRTINVSTTTESVENDEGDYEDVSVTKAECSGVSLKEENFNAFFQNLTGLKLLDSESSGSVAGNLCTITITYSTGRTADVIRIDSSDSSRLPVSLNGETIGTVYKSYVLNLIESAQDLTNGKTVKTL